MRLYSGTINAVLPGKMTSYKLFACPDSGTINAVLPGKMTSYKLFACPAEDMEEAQARALEESYKAFPLIDGWISHEYRLMRIPSDIIVLVIQDVMKELQEVVAKAEASNGK